MKCTHTVRDRTYSGDECPACLAFDRDRLSAERDVALGKAADAERRANDNEGKWRDEIIAAREARDGADRKFEVADLQIGELKKALERRIWMESTKTYGKVCGLCNARQGEDHQKGCLLHKTRDSRQSSGAEMCECGHEAADHEYSRVSDDGQAAWYHPIRCRKCECKKPTLCKRR